MQDFKRFNYNKTCYSEEYITTTIHSAGEGTYDTQDRIKLCRPTGVISKTLNH